MEKQQIYLGVIAITGFVFSYAWFLVNKGSKFWQENWECHIDQLENSISGPLYKTILYRFDSEKQGSDDAVPDSFSVSKVNQAVAFFSMIVWIVLIAISSTDLWYFFCCVVVLSFIAFKMTKYCKSDFVLSSKSESIKSYPRRSIIRK